MDKLADTLVNHLNSYLSQGINFTNKVMALRIIHWLSKMENEKDRLGELGDIVSLFSASHSLDIGSFDTRLPYEARRLGPALRNLKENIATDRLSEVIEDTIPLLPKYEFNNFDEVAELAIYLATFKDRATRQNAANAIAGIYNSEADIEIKIRAIKLMAGLSPGLCQRAAVRARQIFGDGELPTSDTRFLNVLCETNNKKWKRIAHWTQKIITPDMEADVKARILSVIANIKGKTNYQSVVDRAKNLSSSNMSDDEVSVLFESVTQLTLDQAAHTVRHAKAYFTPSMTGYNKASILFALKHCDFDRQISIISAAKKLYRVHMPDHDRVAIVVHLARLPLGIDLEMRTRQILTRLSADILAHDLNEAEAFAWTIELIRNPNRTLTRQNLRITADEAITTERSIVYKAYRALAKERVIVELTPSLADVSSAFKQAMEKIEQQIDRLVDAKEAQMKSDKGSEATLKKQLFQLRVAQEGRKRLQHLIRADFTGAQGLPTIRQLAVLLYRLTYAAPTTNFTESYIAENFLAVQTALPETAGQCSTAGVFLTDHTKLTKHLDDFINQKTFALPTSSNRKGLIALLKEMSAAHMGHEKAKLTDEEQITPIVEVLFMAMRGHNVKLLDPTEENHLACTDGVYLGLMREVASAYQAASDITARIHGVNVVECDSIS